MYDLKNSNFKKNLTIYRKSRGLSLESLGSKIGKTKATVSKYERGEIIPDILTILEICNALNVNLSQLFPSNNLIHNKIYYNPFNSNTVYLYYYVENILITSILEIIEENSKTIAKFYNGVKDINKYAEEYSYYYEGELECDKTNGYVTLRNCTSEEIKLEKVQISFNIPWSKNFKLTNFFILGITPNSIPIIKKGIISVSPLENINKFIDDLKISNTDLNILQKNNAWILNNRNYDHFFFDF